MARRVVRLVAFALCSWVPARAIAQQRDVTGTVTRESSAEAVFGATVVVNSGAVRARTDDHGRFHITLDAGPQEVTVRAIGYLPKTVTVAAAATVVSIELAYDVLKLQALVTTGQATQITRQEAPTSTEVVSASELTSAPAMTVDQALQGKVAGADIQTNSGGPGGGLQVQIRGINTAIGASDPLFVVDGVIYSNETVPTGLYNVTASGENNGTGPPQDDAVNRLADINPADIESIEILKSAAASSIYGSKAANGVVVITTKRGHAGKPQWSFNEQVGLSHLLRGPETRSFTVAQADSLYGGAETPYIVNGELPTYNHLNEIAGRTPLDIESNLTMSGGNDNTRYLFSAGLTNQGGIISATGADRKSIRFNIDQHIAKGLEGSFTGAFNSSVEDRGFVNNDNAGASVTYAIAYIPGFVNMQPNADGVYPQLPLALSYKGANPLQTIALGANQNTVNRFTGGTHLTYTALSTDHNTLQFIGTGGLDYFNDQSHVVMPGTAYFEALQAQPGVSVLGLGQNQYYNWNLNALHTYTGGGVKAATSFGVSYEDREFNTASTAATGLVGDQRTIDAGASITNTQVQSHDGTLALYAQEEFHAISDHLLVELGLRGERSSNNGSTGAYNLYPKAAGSYTFDDWFGHGSTFKLRAAYGETGNLPLFGQKYTLLNTTNAIGGLIGEELGTGGIAADPDIKPERTREVEGGFDATAWQGRADLEVTLYSRRTTGLILPRTPAPSTGYDEVYENGGTFQNQGIEIGGTVIPIQTRRFSWTFQTSFNSLRNTVISLPFPSFRPATAGFGLAYGEFLVEPGRPISQIIGTDASGDIDYLGQVNPEFRWSFTNTFTYRNWLLSGLWDWQLGGVAENQTLSLYGCNQLNANAETPLGQEEINACFDGNAGPYVQSTTFLKLRELRLAYDLGPRISHYVFGANSLTLGLSGRNLILITKYFGYDPEVSNFGQQAITRGVDLAPYPPARSFYFTVTAGF
jgi:TonB-dependent starch-binding outer membrane protein SusC